MFSITATKASLGASHQRTRSVRPSRTTRPIAVAGLKEGGDWFASGFLKNFTPPNDSGVNWTGTSTGYSVAPRRGRSRNPAPVAAKKEAEASETGEMYASDEARQAQEAQGMLAHVAEYLAGALQRVIGHNFKGDETEPDWKATRGRGWSGDIRKRDQDGFHSRKL